MEASESIVLQPRARLRLLALQWVGAFAVLMSLALALAGFSLWHAYTSSRLTRAVEHDLGQLAATKASLLEVERTAALLMAPVHELLLRREDDFDAGSTDALARRLDAAVGAAATAVDRARETVAPDLPSFTLDAPALEVTKAVAGALATVTDKGGLPTAERVALASYWYQNLRHGVDRLNGEVDAAQHEVQRRLDAVVRAAEQRKEVMALAVLLGGLGAAVYAAMLWRRIRRELTQREELLQQLAAARQRDGQQALELQKLSWVAKRTSNSVIIAGADGRAQWVNEGFTKVSGYAAHEVLGRRPGELLQGPETDRDTIARISARLRAGEPVDEEVLNYHKNGELFWVRLDIHPVRDDRGTLTHYVAVQTDVSAQKSIELQLQRARDLAVTAAEARGQFIANTSHEIRTPMNGVLGMTELLLRTDLDERQRRLADTILRSGRHLLTLLNDVLDFSKMESGRLDFDPQPTDLARLLEDARAVVAESAQRKGLLLEVQAHPAAMPQVLVDPMRLRQVLSNLLNNAVKFTSEGRVTLAATLQRGARDGVSVAFSVADTGIGIAPRLQQHIFEPFVQADAGTATRFGGTGLGLAISRQLVRLMGGEITVRSDVNQGANFSFVLELPLAATDSIATTAMPALAGLGLDLLVAEDYPVNQEVIREMLGELGCRMTLARNGREAVELFVERGGGFDAVLMDCRMPKMDGFEATRAIRAWEAGRPDSPVRIFALTAGALATEREHCAEVGMNGFLAKPVTLGELYDALAPLAGLAGLAAAATAPTTADRGKAVHDGSGPRALGGAADGSEELAASA